MVKIDLKDFFHSIDERRIYCYFMGLDFPPLVALELARLCTRVVDGASPIVDFAGRYFVIPTYTTPRLGVLPQGAPTSGVLANRVLRGFDARTQELALRSGCEYTRYADDIVLSGAGPFSRQFAADLISELRLIAQTDGFALNDKKTRIVPPGARFLVLGLHVLDDRVGLPREFKRRLDQIVHGVKSHGPAQYARHHRFVSSIGFVNHVDGLIAYAKGIDRPWAEVAEQRWRVAVESSISGPTSLTSTSVDLFKAY